MLIHSFTKSPILHDQASSSSSSSRVGLARPLRPDAAAPVDHRQFPHRGKGSAGEVVEQHHQELGEDLEPGEVHQRPARQEAARLQGQAGSADRGQGAVQTGQCRSSREEQSIGRGDDKFTAGPCFDKLNGRLLIMVLTAGMNSDHG